MGKFTWLLIFILIGKVAFAQQEVPKFGEGQVIKANKPKKDTLQAQLKPIQSEKPLQDSLPNNNSTDGAATVGDFNLYIDLTSVHTDTMSRTLGELQVVKVSEDLKIDCVWVKSAEYYAIWDSKNINPYGRDASIFKDTIDIRLYDIPKGELWSAPLDKTLQTSAFGYRWGRFHHGVDLDLDTGDPVFSVFDGIVRISAFQSGYGNYVVVRHKNGLETLYGHMSLRKVEVGQVIKSGQLIGLGGSTGWSTGPHLHFEVRYEGNSFNPLLIYDFSKEEQLLTERFSLMPQHFRHLGNQVRLTFSHQVVPGETLSIISAKYNVSVLTLAKLNRLSVNSVLKVGQTLLIVK